MKRESTNTMEHGSLRKRWLLLLPAVFITYSLAYVDRANFGFGAAAGLAATLHITGNQTSLLSAMFFLGYFLFQLPGVMLAKKCGIARLVFMLLIVWGVLASLTGILHQFWMLVVDRLLLGVAESFIFPAMLFLLTNWFTRAERSRANTILMLGNPVTVLWMSVITGYVIQSFGWQETFVIEGAPAILWAVVWIALVRDRPSEVWWMDPRAAGPLEDALTHEQLSVTPVGAVRKALLRGDVLLLSAQYFLWSVGVYGFILWLPTIVQQGSALSMGRTGVLSAIPYFAAVLLMLLVSYISDKTQRRVALVWPFLLVSGIAMLGSFVFAERNFTLAFICLVVSGGCMYAPYGPFYAIIPDRLPRNVTAEVMALINSCGALGSFTGVYFVGFLRSVTGNSRAGFLLMSFVLVCSALILFWLPASTSPERTREMSQT